MKHGDIYTAKDGRELMVVEAPTNKCRFKDFLPCELGSPLEGEPANALCREYGPDGPPCGIAPIIFVNKEKYLTYKLLGTAESSS